METKFNRQFVFNKINFIKSILLFIFILLFLITAENKAQQPTLFPDAAWLQDVHWTGTVYAGISGPVIPNAQAHLEGVEYMFYLKSDVEKARPLIEKVHSQGKKYWVNLDAGTIEGNLDSVLNDGQGITDPNFGAMMTLEGNYMNLGDNVIRSVNRPEWRNYLISCIKRAIDAGADGSQHDGGSTVTYNSFDDDEVNGFKIYIEQNGIPTWDWDPNTETFRSYLLSKGKNDNNVFENDSDPQNLKDLINHWKDFKAVNSLNSWLIIRDSCRAYAQSKGKDYTLALNAGSDIGTHFGHTYLASDYGIGEFFQWGNLFPYTGTLAAKARMFEAINKRFVLWSEPTLGDVPKEPYEPFPPDIEQGSYIHTIATLYASGGLPQLKYTALDTYPAYQLAQMNKDILNSVSPAGKIGVVMSHAQTMNETRGLEGLISVLQDLNRSFKIVWFKSNRLGLNDDITQDDINKYEVIFLPEVFFLTNNQRSQLLTYMWNGGTVVAVRGNVEYSGWVDEYGNNQTDATWASLADDNTSGVKSYGSGKFINIAHNILEPNGYPPSLYGLAYIIYKSSPNTDELRIAHSIKDTISSWLDLALPEKDVVSNSLPSSLKIFRYQDTLSNHYVYQFLSDSVELPTRKAIPVNSFDVELAVDKSSYNSTFSAKFYTIDNPYGILLNDTVSVNNPSGRVTLTIPSFNRWGFIDLTESHQIGKVAVSDIKINESETPYRLKSGSNINVSWSVQNSQSNKYELEIWTNLEGVGSPVISKQNNLNVSTSKINPNLMSKANKVLYKTFQSSTNSYTVLGTELKDSTVYLLRLRAIELSDTSSWTQKFFYRNAKPGSPTEPALYTSFQSTWYLWSKETPTAPPDTSYNLIFSFKKGVDNRGRYGGDYELDTLLYGIKIYTDSLDSKQGTDTSHLYYIGSQFNRKLGPFESYNGLDDIVDTLKFSLKNYENYGIYIQPFATDFLDTSDGGDIFGFYLDNHNDPPSEFNLISPQNNSYTLQQIPFSWKNNGDPDPFNGINHEISKVEIWFDSVSTFNSPGYKFYSKDRVGSGFDKDTITIDLPPNFFETTGLINYKKIYWKAVMFDYDRSVSKDGVLSRESTDIFVLNIGGVPNKPNSPTLVYPANNSVVSTEPVNFLWNNVSNADSYWLEISADSLFTNTMIDSSLLTNSKEVNGLQESQTYWWRVRAKNISGWGNFSQTNRFSTLITKVEEEKIPETYSLEQNFPNPFNPSTTIKFSIPKQSFVSISIYDLLGRKIYELVNENLRPGYYQRTVNLNNLASGIYIYKLETDSFTDLKKMILIK